MKARLRTLWTSKKGKLNLFNTQYLSSYVLYEFMCMHTEVTLKIQTVELKSSVVFSPCNIMWVGKCRTNGVSSGRWPLQQGVSGAFQEDDTIKIQLDPGVKNDLIWSEEWLKWRRLGVRGRGLSHLSGPRMDVCLLEWRMKVIRRHGRLDWTAWRWIWIRQCGLDSLCESWRRVELGIWLNVKGWGGEEG